MRIPIVLVRPKNNVHIVGVRKWSETASIRKETGVALRFVDEGSTMNTDILCFEIFPRVKDRMYILDLAVAYQTFIFLFLCFYTHTIMDIGYFSSVEMHWTNSV